MCCCRFQSVSDVSPSNGGSSELSASVSDDSSGSDGAPRRKRQRRAAAPRRARGAGGGRYDADDVSASDSSGDEGILRRRRPQRARRHTAASQRAAATAAALAPTRQSHRLQQAAEESRVQRSLEILEQPGPATRFRRSRVAEIAPAAAQPSAPPPAKRARHEIADPSGPSSSSSPWLDLVSQASAVRRAGRSAPPGAGTGENGGTHVSEVPGEHADAAGSSHLDSDTAGAAAVVGSRSSLGTRGRLTLRRLGSLTTPANQRGSSRTAGHQPPAADGMPAYPAPTGSPSPAIGGADSAQLLPAAGPVDTLANLQNLPSAAASGTVPPPQADRGGATQADAARRGAARGRGSGRITIRPLRSRPAPAAPQSAGQVAADIAMPSDPPPTGPSETSTAKAAETSAEPCEPSTAKAAETSAGPSEPSTIKVAEASAGPCEPLTIKAAETSAAGPCVPSAASPSAPANISPKDGASAKLQTSHREPRSSKAKRKAVDGIQDDDEQPASSPASPSAPPRSTLPRSGSGAGDAVSPQQGGLLAAGRDDGTQGAAGASSGPVDVPVQLGDLPLPMSIDGPGTGSPEPSQGLQVPIPLANPEDNDHHNLPTSGEELPEASASKPDPKPDWKPTDGAAQNGSVPDAATPQGCDPAADDVVEPHRAEQQASAAAGARPSTKRARKGSLRSAASGNSSQAAPPAAGGSQGPEGPNSTTAEPQSLAHRLRGSRSNAGTPTTSPGAAARPAAAANGSSRPARGVKRARN